MSSLSVTSENISQELKTIDFHGQTLITVERNNIIYAAVKPICENIGLDWNGQRQRIQRDEVLSEGACMINAPSKGGIQTMLCLPIKYLNGWLFGVDEKRIKPEVKPKLLEYKRECYQVLHDYWHKGEATNPRLEPLTPEQQAQIRTAVAKRCKNNRLHYQTLYTALNSHFNKPRYSEIFKKDFDEALSFISSFRLDDEVSPINDFTYNEYIKDVKAEILDYVWALQSEVKRLNGNLPDYPKFDKEAICQAFIVRMIQSSRMFLTFNRHDGTPSVNFIPAESYVVSSENIVDIANSIDKKQLPKVMEAIIKRLTR